MRYQKQAMSLLISIQTLGACLWLFRAVRYGPPFWPGIAFQSFLPVASVGIILNEIAGSVVKAYPGRPSLDSQLAELDGLELKE